MPEHAALPTEIKRIGAEIHSSLSSNNPVLERAREWAENKGIDNIDDRDRIICNLAAYNRLLKTTLYELYQIEGPELRAIDDPEKISDRLVEAREVTGDKAFERFVLDDVGDAVHPNVYEPLNELRHRLVDADEPTEDIGRIFERLVPSASRRKLGQFRTPEYIAETMARWAICSGSDSVLDPGMGAGALTSAAYKAKQRAVGGQCVDEMHGIDLSQLSVVMAATALKIVNGGGTPQFKRADFLDTVAEGETSRLLQSENGGLVNMPTVDVVICNPPFSRHQEMSKKDKERVNDIASANAAMDFDLRSPMYLYFIVHAAQFLDDGGRMAVITPSEWLETDYGEKLREFLLNQFAVRGVVVYDPETKVFDGAKTTGCISFLEKRDGGAGDCATTFLQLNQWPGVDAVLDAVEGDSAVGKASFGYLNRLPQTELLPQDWTNYLDPESVDELPELTPFHEVAEIKRGIATGANDFFCLSDEEVRERGISEEYIVKLIRRTNGLAYELRDADWEEWRESGDEVWLLYCYNDKNELVERHDIDDPAVEEYISEGEADGANVGYLVEKRNPWYRVEKRTPPPIFVTYMSKSGFRFIKNEAGAVSLNNLHNVSFPDKDYSDRDIKALLAYLNSNIVNQIIERSGREYAGGLHKIEPGELKHIPVIDPEKMQDDDVITLSRYFDDIADVARTGEVPLQEAMAELDEKIADILNIDR
ncbi:N-6 DNA methylase [Haloferax volcanii]|uniref:N-6 DNA methylase n=1 Tax=Haloferax volcanii TaxID=2246 RepID=UPI0038540FE1